MMLIAFRPVHVLVKRRSLPRNIIRRLSEWKLEETLTSVIGLEIHAQIKSKSKLFSGAGNKFMAPSNSLVSNYDAAIPGTLPVLNKRCVEAAVLTALALNCKLNFKSQFDRKHYFYADMPQGYQITQQRCPIAVDGSLDILLEDGAVAKKVNIQQVQLEQDSGKSLHDDIGNQTCIDLNRANVGLLEIVTCPDLTGVEDTCTFVKELQMMLQHLDACDGKMQEGQLRVDVNLSITQENGENGARAEIKNISGISALKRVIEYEIERQKRVIREGGSIYQETRHYDEVKGITVSMRDKEKKQDYRFMPEPNLPPLVLYTDETAPKNTTSNYVNVDDIRRRMPSLPGQMRSTLMRENGLSYAEASFLLEKDLAAYYLDVMRSASDLPPKLPFHWMQIKLTELQRTVGFTADNSVVSAQQLADLLTMEHRKQINQEQSKQAFEIALSDTRTPVQIAEDSGWVVMADLQVLTQLCRATIDQLSREDPEFLAPLRDGKPSKAAVLLIVDRAAKLSDRKLKPKLLKQLARRELIKAGAER